jgi:hypothetical protein
VEHASIPSHEPIVRLLFLFESLTELWSKGLASRTLEEDSPHRRAL